MTLDIERYLDTSEKLDLTGIDWEEAARVGLSDAERYTLTYFADIESQTIMYMKEVLGTKSALEPDVMAFLGMWNYEELFHGRALYRMLEVCGAPLPENRAVEVRNQSHLVETIDYLLSKALSKIAPDAFTALYMTWGAVQEITTLRGYETLIANTTNPALRELCTRIAKQERRHFAWYFNSARERLAKSKVSQSIVRWVIAKAWTPVGVGVKSEAEVHDLFGALFPGPLSAWLSAEVDTKISSLPGLGGLTLMTTYLHDLDARMSRTRGLRAPAALRQERIAS